ncbi:hypothetical protein BDB01DRAFT_772147 [Pilobolus umbonatus]|nr:hypothetical protein BDB01DRAFT_772147 [Pilobolus umbonatus]
MKKSTATESSFPLMDCSKVIDILTEQPVHHYQLPPLSPITLSSTFNSTDLFKRVYLMRNAEYLILCDDHTAGRTLIYLPIPINNILIRTILPERELIGEYNIQFWVNQKKILTMKSAAKEERDAWFSIDGFHGETDTHIWKPMSSVTNHDINRSSTLRNKLVPQEIRTEDIFQFYTNHSGEVSPLGTSSDESEVDVDTTWKVNKSMTADKSTIEGQTLMPVPMVTSSSVNSNKALPIPTDRSKSLPSHSKAHPKKPIPSEMLKSNTISRGSSSIRNTHTMSIQQPIVDTLVPNQNIAPSSEPAQQGHRQPIKKKSFMRSVMSALQPRSSLISKKSTDNIADPRLIAMKEGYKQNYSAVSLDGTPSQPYATNNASAPNLSQPTPGNRPPVPQHLTIPSSSKPLVPIHSDANNSSTTSFTSSVNSSSQSSLTLTPPLSRPSSPARNQSPSSSSSLDLVSSPPGSPDASNRMNSIKGILYSSNECIVFRWKDESWYAVEDKCLLEVRQTYSSQTCIAIHLESSGQFYLNAWILPDTIIQRISETDLSLTLHMNTDQSTIENYLIHCKSKIEADVLYELLERIHQESGKLSTVEESVPLERVASMSAASVLTAEELAKTLKLAMQCKCKLYIQSASSKWSPFGSVYMKISQQVSTKKMHVAIESHKGEKVTHLVNAMVQSRNVERLGPKRISFLFVDANERNSVVYMIRVREESSCDKILEYTKVTNAENGW